MANGIKLTDIGTQMRDSLIVDPAAENLRRVREREQGMLNRLNISPNRLGGTLARSTLGILAKTPEYARKGLGLQTKEEASAGQIQNLMPGMDEASRYRAIAAIYRKQGLQNRAERATQQAMLLERTAKQDQLEEEQLNFQRGVEIQRLKNELANTASQIERRRIQSEIDGLQTQISQGRLGVDQRLADNTVRLGDNTIADTQFDNELAQRLADNTVRLGDNTIADTQFDNKLAQARFDSAEQQRAFDNNIAQSALALDTAQLAELVSQNAAENDQFAQRFGLDQDRFEQAVLRDAHGMALATGQYNIKQAEYLLNAAKFEAERERESTSANFLAMMALGETDPMTNRILHLAADNNVPISETLATLDILKGDPSVSANQAAKVADFATSLRAVTDEQGNPQFTEEQAQSLAQSYVLGTVDFIVSETGRLQIVNKPQAIANALSGNTGQGDNTGLIEVPSTVTEFIPERRAPGLWDKADLITGFTNIAPDVIQRIGSSFGVPIDVNQARSEALQRLRIASGLARDAFRDDDRMSNLDALQIAEEFGLAASIGTDSDTWRARSVVVDNGLRQLRDSVRFELQNVGSQQRKDKLNSQLSAINRLRTELGVPAHVSVEHWDEQMINSMTAQQLHEVNQLRPDAAAAWGRSNPELEQLVINKMISGGIRPRGK